MYSNDKKDDIRWLCGQQSTVDLFKFKAGDKLLVIGNLNTPYDQFETVTAISDTEPGIFETRPFIKVQNALGIECCMHASRCVPFDRVGEPK